MVTRLRKTTRRSDYTELQFEGDIMKNSYTVPERFFRTLMQENKDIDELMSLLGYRKEFLLNHIREKNTQYNLELIYTNSGGDRIRLKNLKKLLKFVTDKDKSDFYNKVAIKD